MTFIGGLETIYFPLNMSHGDKIVEPKTGKILFQHKGKQVDYGFLGFNWKGYRGLTIKNQKELDILITNFSKRKTNEKLILKVAKYLNDIDGRSYGCWSKTMKTDQQFCLNNAKALIKIIKEFKNE